MIGTGTMGLAIVSRLVVCGYRVHVYDSKPENMQRAEREGALPVRSVAEMAALCNPVLLCLPSSTVTEEVCTCSAGLFGHTPRGNALIDLGTGNPTQTTALAAAAEARGITLLDAPVSGGFKNAETGKLSIMVGGDYPEYLKYEELLHAIGTSVTYLGPAGMGHTAKIVNNIVSGANLIALCEGLVLGVKSGLAIEPLLDSINAGEARSYMSRVKKTALVTEDFTPGAKVSIHAKCEDIALDLGRSLGVFLPVCSLTGTIYHAMLYKGMGELDTAAVYKFLEEYAGGGRAGLISLDKPKVASYTLPRQKEFPSKEYRPAAHGGGDWPDRHRTVESGTGRRTEKNGGR